MATPGRRALLGSAKEIYRTLSDDERRGLRNLKPEIAKLTVDARVEKLLIEKGLAERKLGGLGLTARGKAAASLLPLGVY